jgi:hypothetical protein
MTEAMEAYLMTTFYLWGSKTYPHSEDHIPHGGLWKIGLCCWKDLHAMGLINVHPVGNYRAISPTAKGRALLALVGDKS